jgi:hypothetical protein
MRPDALNYIEMEKDPEGDPGRIGDACAETFRVRHLKFFLIFRKPVDELAFKMAKLEVLTAYQGVRRDSGFLRHPALENYVDKKGKSWGVTDYTFDQGLPMYLCVWAYGLNTEGLEIEERWEKKWQTAPGKFLPPNYFVMKQRNGGWQSVVTDLPLLLQAWGMKYLPYRWSDDPNKKWYQRFEKMESSSADYLNWLHLILQAEYKGHTFISRRAKNAFTSGVVMGKIRAYYLPEPNSEWVVALYQQAIDQVYKPL